MGRGIRTYDPRHRHGEVVGWVVGSYTHDPQIILDIWKAYDMRLERVLGVVECPSFFWCYGLSRLFLTHQGALYRLSLPFFACLYFTS